MCQLASIVLHALNKYSFLIFIRNRERDTIPVLQIRKLRLRNHHLLKLTWQVYGKLGLKLWSIWSKIPYLWPWVQYHWHQGPIWRTCIHNWWCIHGDCSEALCCSDWDSTSHHPQSSTSRGWTFALCTPPLSPRALLEWNSSPLILPPGTCC